MIKKILISVLAINVLIFVLAYFPGDTAKEAKVALVEQLNSGAHYADEKIDSLLNAPNAVAAARVNNKKKAGRYVCGNSICEIDKGESSALCPTDCAIPSNDGETATGGTTGGSGSGTSSDTTATGGTATSGGTTGGINGETSGNNATGGTTENSGSGTSGGTTANGGTVASGGATSGSTGGTTSDSTNGGTSENTTGGTASGGTTGSASGGAASGTAGGTAESSGGGTSTDATPTVRYENVFIDNLASGWTLGGWNDTASVIEGGAITVTNNGGWSGFTIDHRVNWQFTNLNSANYMALEFDITPGAPLVDAHRSLRGYLMGDTDPNSAIAPVLSAISPLQAGATAHIRIPLTSMPAFGDTFKSIVIYNYSGTSGFSYKVDNIRLEIASNGAQSGTASGSTGTAASGTTGGTSSGATATGGTVASGNTTEDTTATSGYENVFIDAIGDGWILGGYNNAVGTVSGGEIIVSQGDAWSGLHLDHRDESWNWSPISPADLASLEFDFTPVTDPATNVCMRNLSIHLGSAEEGASNGEDQVISQLANLSVGVKSHISIPMMTLASGGYSFLRIALFNNCGDGNQTNIRYRLDNIIFVHGAGPTQTIIGGNTGGSTGGTSGGSSATPGSATFTINATGTRTAVSPFIYGINWQGDFANRSDVPAVPFVRYGGNRNTTYNWELNVSNAGTDYNNSSDRYLTMYEPENETRPGEYARQAVERGFARNWATLLTIPIIDWLPADANGAVSSPASANSTRWVANRITKPDSLSLTPNLTDGVVYQDEFVNLIQSTYPNAQTNAAGPVMYSLDNEPGLWSDTHPLAHPTDTTYAEMATRTLAAGRMIKSLAPDAMVFGPASYGWNEFINMQNATDARGQTLTDNFLTFYLDTLRQEEQTNGTRIVDVLDLHWYPEAQGGGTRIGENSVNPTAAVIEARMQAPRSLWDSNYRETSWINNWVGGPIRLISWAKELIAAHYPGTKLAITEYNYGGGSNITGGVVEADVLGVFGREGLYAATIWNMGTYDYIWGGLNMYLNYDGAGSRVGSMSVPASTSNDANSSVYAFSDPNDPASLQVVAINKTLAPLDITLNLANASGFTAANLYRLSSASAAPQAAGSVAVTGGNTVTTQLPAMTVTTMRFHR